MGNETSAPLSMTMPANSPVQQHSYLNQPHTKCYSGYADEYSTSYPLNKRVPCDLTFVNSDYITHRKCINVCSDSKTTNPDCRAKCTFHENH